jgi:hypothetical protein
MITGYATSDTAVGAAREGAYGASSKAEGATSNFTTTQLATSCRRLRPRRGHRCRIGVVVVHARPRIALLGYGCRVGGAVLLKACPAPVASFRDLRPDGLWPAIVMLRLPSTGSGSIGSTWNPTGSGRRRLRTLRNALHESARPALGRGHPCFGLPPSDGSPTGPSVPRPRTRRNSPIFCGTRFVIAVLDLLSRPQDGKPPCPNPQKYRLTSSLEMTMQEVKDEQT